MKGLLFIILFCVPLLAFPQAEKPYRSIIIDSLKALNGGNVDVKDTLSLDSLAVYNTDLSSKYTSRSLVDSAFVGVAMNGMIHDAVTLSGTPNYITLSGQDIVRGLIDLGTDITGTTTATSISDFDTEVSNNASVSANTAKVTNVTTNLSEGTTTNTTVDVNSSDGSNATLVAASTTRAGVMTKAKFDEIVVNNAKVSNATHTQDVTGSTALTINKTAISGKTSVTAASADEILIGDASDGGNLKRVTAQSIADLGGTDGDGIYDGGGSLTANPTTVAQAANKLQFTSSIVDGFSVDGTTFSIDANNNRVGIGTIAPTTRFHVKGGLTTLEGINAASTSDVLFLTDNTGVTPLLIVENGGDVGINTSDPSHLLTVLADVGGGVGEGIALRRGSFISAALLSTSTFGGYFTLRNASGTETVSFNNSNAVVDDFINTGRRFGIGTSTVGAKLDVKNNEGVFTAIFEQTNASFNNTLKLITPAGQSVAIRFSDGSDRAEIQSGTTDNLIFKTSGTTNTPLELTGSGNALLCQVSGNVGIGDATPDVKLDVVGDVIIEGNFSTATDVTTLGVAATTFPVLSNVMTMTGDGGGNTVATITGANSGMILTMIFVDANITITDTDDGGADTIDLGSAFTSADDTTLMLVFDGTLWREVNRSVN